MSSSALIISLFSFFIICVASRQFGKSIAKINMPLITGFLLCGIVSGPEVLGLIEKDFVLHLKFIDQASLAFIAFAAGAEVVVEQLKQRYSKIKLVLRAFLVSTFVFCGVGFYLMAPYMDNISNFSAGRMVALALLCGSIMIARSPSSAIAIIKELKAKGSFSQTVLTVTVIIDVLVILLFSMSFSYADVVFSGEKFSIFSMMFIVGEIIVSAGLGWLLGVFISSFMAINATSYTKTLFVLLIGYFVFFASELLKEYSHLVWHHVVILEPLLICMVAGCYVANYSSGRDVFMKAMHRAEVPVYVAFFTLTGASLSLHVIALVWPLTIAMVLLRTLSMFIGGYIGGTLAGEDKKQNLVGWMAYITQAGVGLGLAKQVASSFPEWGGFFATFLISVIVVNQIIGPPLMRWALFILKEARKKAKKSDVDIEHSAIIFGAGGVSYVLARQLYQHGWRVKLVYIKEDKINKPEDLEIETQKIDEINLDVLNELKVKEAGAVIMLKTDEDNLKIAQLCYDNFPDVHLVTKLNDLVNRQKFIDLETYVVFPNTAVASLMDHYVRSPSAVSLLFDYADDHDLLEIEIKNKSLEGMPLRSLRFSKDVLFMSVKRNGRSIDIHNYYRIRPGDLITVAGPQKELREIEKWFGR